MAILDVNRLVAVTRTTPTGFLSNLVQRERLGWPTCMPIYFLFDTLSWSHRIYIGQSCSSQKMKTNTLIWGIHGLLAVTSVLSKLAT